MSNINDDKTLLECVAQESGDRLLGLCDVLSQIRLVCFLCG